MGIGVPALNKERRIVGSLREVCTYAKIKDQTVGECEICGIKERDWRIRGGNLHRDNRI